MKRAIVLLLTATSALLAEAPQFIQLSQPDTKGGVPLMQALSERRSTREFSPEKLGPQTLSNLLWAAYGVNRPDGKRTAPSAMNRQTVDVYVTMPEGVYLYRAKEHRLDLVVAGDFRPAAGKQDFVGQAALNLVYVSDGSKLAGADEDRIMYTSAEAGFIGENVYLFCASERLATVVRGMIDRPALAKILRLRPDQKIILAQTVGYPKKGQ